MDLAGDPALFFMLQQDSSVPDQTSAVWKTAPVDLMLRPGLTKRHVFSVE